MHGHISKKVEPTMWIHKKTWPTPIPIKKGAGHADPDISQGYINSGLVFVIGRTN